MIDDHGPSSRSNGLITHGHSSSMCDKAHSLLLLLHSSADIIYQVGDRAQSFAAIIAPCVNMTHSSLFSLRCWHWLQRTSVQGQGGGRRHGTPSICSQHAHGTVPARPSSTEPCSCTALTPSTLSPLGPACPPSASPLTHYLATIRIPPHSFPCHNLHPPHLLPCHQLFRANDGPLQTPHLTFIFPVMQNNLRTIIHYRHFANSSTSFHLLRSTTCIPSPMLLLETLPIL